MVKPSFPRNIPGYSSLSPTVRSIFTRHANRQLQEELASLSTTRVRWTDRSKYNADGSLRGA